MRFVSTPPGATAEVTVVTPGGQKSVVTIPKTPAALTVKNEAQISATFSLDGHATSVASRKARPDLEVAVQLVAVENAKPTAKKRRWGKRGSWASRQKKKKAAAKAKAAAAAAAAAAAPPKPHPPKKEEEDCLDCDLK